MTDGDRRGDDDRTRLDMYIYQGYRWGIPWSDTWELRSSKSRGGGVIAVRSMGDVAVNETEQTAAADLAGAVAPTTTTAAADDVNARPAAAVLDPQLFMAARCGDSEKLKELLLPNDGDQQGGPAEPTAAAAATATTTIEQVVVQVDQPSPPAHPSSSSPPSSCCSRSAASLLHLLDGVTSNEGDSLLHVVASCGDGDSFLDCAEMIYQGRSSLLVARNNKGNTPLHCAAGAGNADMVSCIIALAVAAAEAAGDETTVTKFLRMRNKFGETALHQAVRAGSKASIDKLMSVDPELASVPRQDDEGNTTSPLYLAILLDKMDITAHLIDKTDAKLSWSGPDGRNVLHAAVTRGKKALSMLLESLKDVTSQLTMQRDNDGSTPLHLAASLDWWPLWWVVSGRFHVWPWSGSIAKQLLDANICSAYQPDNKGLYPIHIAALADNLHVTKVLLQMCPGCATLQDGQGRTFLHVAVGRGSGLGSTHTVAYYACRQSKLSSVLNVQDNNGDTALHHAVHVGNLEVFNCLIRNPQVDLCLPNKDDLTPLDLSWIKISSRNLYYDANPRAIISKTLVLVGAPAGGSRSDLFCQKYICEIDEEKMSSDLASTTQPLGIVSVLIATVTFAAAFTLPGGSYQEKKDGGMPGTPMLAHKYAFAAFILADALAFVSSLVATFAVVFASMPSVELSLRLHYTNISWILVHASGRSLVVTFALGFYLVLQPIDKGLAILVCVVCSAALLCGNREAWQMLCRVNTTRARLGVRRVAAWCDLAPYATLSALFPFIFVIVPFLATVTIKNWDKIHSRNWDIAAEWVLMALCVVVVAPPILRLFLVQKRKL